MSWSRKCCRGFIIPILRRKRERKEDGERERERERERMNKLVASGTE